LTQRFSTASVVGTRDISKDLHEKSQDSRVCVCVCESVCVCACVCVCDKLNACVSLSVIKCKKNPLNLK